MPSVTVTLIFVYDIGSGIRYQVSNGGAPISPPPSLQPERARPRTCLTSLLSAHVLEVNWLAIDPALRRRDVVGELARLEDRLHLQAAQIVLVSARRQPFVLTPLPLLVGHQVARRIEAAAGVDADVAIE